ncbi:MAG: IS200/IS605 family transposase [Streptomyces sp.]
MLRPAHRARGPPRLRIRTAAHPRRRPARLALPNVLQLIAPPCRGSLKGVCARRIRQEFTGHINHATTHGHLWSPSCFSASCGGAPLAALRQYVEQQKRRSEVARQSSLEMHSSPTRTPGLSVRSR